MSDTTFHSKILNVTENNMKYNNCTGTVTVVGNCIGINLTRNLSIAEQHKRDKNGCKRRFAPPKELCGIIGMQLILKKSLTFDNWITLEWEGSDDKLNTISFTCDSVEQSHKLRNLLVEMKPSASV